MWSHSCQPGRILSPPIRVRSSGKTIDYYTFSSCLLTQVPPTSPAEWTWGQRAVQGTAWQIPVCIVIGSQGLRSQTTCKTGWRSQCIIFLSSRGKGGIIHLLITFNQSLLLWLYLINPYHDPSLTTVILRLHKVTVASPVGCYSPQSQEQQTKYGTWIEFLSAAPIFLRQMCFSMGYLWDLEILMNIW